MKTLSMDLRERIVAAREEGHSAAELARRFKVSKRSVERFWKSHCSVGHARPKRRGGYRTARLMGHQQVVRGWIRHSPDLTLAELQQRCRDELGVEISTSGLWSFLERIGLSFKKNSPRRRADPTRRGGRPRTLEKQPA